MSIATARGRKLSAVTFLFVLAVCAAFAAHERLHDFELAHDGHESNHHDDVIHEHPGVASASLRLDNARVCAGAVPSLQIDSRLFTSDTRPTRLRGGPLLFDDDVGLHDLLSVYRI